MKLGRIFPRLNTREEEGEEGERRGRNGWKGRVGKELKETGPPLYFVQEPPSS